jgi:single-strand DNA-binding protein
MYNKVILVGNLTRDVEVRYSQSGSAIGKVGIATNRRWRDQSGEQKEETMFIDLTFFGRTAEIANQYLRKGSKVLVEGRLVLEQWTAQDGSKHSRHTITVQEMKMLDSKGDMPATGGYGAPVQESGYGQAPAYEQPAAAPAATQAQPATPSVPEIDIDEDEIPF